MNESITKAKEFIEWSEGMAYIDIYEGHWQIDEESSEVMWSLDVDEEWEYSSEVNGAAFRKDGCVIVNTDNGCGDTVTMIFLEHMEIVD